MSSQKGNSNRTRPQKYKNRTAFKNNLHDTSGKTKMINSIQVSDVCIRCKEIIEWKIKYKKYKPLSQPKKCVKCDGRTVKQAYHVMCVDCGRKLGQCTKCCQSKEVIVAPPSAKNEIELDREMKQLLQTLPERKRRTFIRYLNKKNSEKKLKEDSKDEKDKDKEKEDNDDKEDLRAKLKALQVDDDDDSDFDFDDDDDNGEDEDEEDDDDLDK